ncbi:MAG: RodZ domain-containing protein [Thermoanaerobaculia bacterium]
MSQPASEEPSRPADHSPAAALPISFGAWLRHQREARSVSLREIADNSKISLRYLEALEQDRFDVLPAPVFARGFLREYARVVGLNADEVVNLYLVALEERGGDVARRADRPKGTRIESTSSAPSSLGYGLLLGLAVVVFVGIAALLSFLAERRRSAPPTSKLVAPTTMAAPAPPTEPSDDGAGASSGVSATSAASATTATTATTGVPEGTATATSVAGGQVPSGAPRLPAPSSATPLSALPADAPTARVGSRSAATPFRVVLNFTQDCWMESIVDGTRQTSELKAAGETVHLEAQQYVVLTLGNSRAVTVEVDGAPVALPENATRVVREFRIDRPAPAADSPTPASPTKSQAPPAQH